MRQFVAIGVLSILVFAAGYGVRIWVDGHRPLPVPPGPLMGEFAPKPPPAPAPQHPLNRAELAAQIEQYSAQMAVYHTRIAAIDAEFERNLLTILTPEQAAHHTAFLQRSANKPPHPPGPEDSQPLTDAEITGLLQKPLWNFFTKIALQIRVDSLNAELKFDADQQEKVRELLRQRREAFLGLVDSLPPPSLYLISLAPAAQRLGAPKADATAAAKP